MQAATWYIMYNTLTLCHLLSYHQQNIHRVVGNYAPLMKTPRTRKESSELILRVLAEGYGQFDFYHPFHTQLIAMAEDKIWCSTFLFSRVPRSEEGFCWMTPRFTYLRICFMLCACCKIPHWGWRWCLFSMITKDKITYYLWFLFRYLWIFVIKELNLNIVRIGQVSTQDTLDTVLHPASKQLPIPGRW